MAEIFQTTLSPSKLQLITGWMSRQRWYATKGREPQLRRLGGYRLDDPIGEVGIETLIVLDEGGPAPIVYQVPLTYRSAPLAGAEAGLIGTIEHGVLGTRYVYDGPHDPVYAEQLLALARGRALAQHASISFTLEPDVVGHPHPASGDVTPSASRVLGGEQSNTSIVYEATGPDGSASPVIIKVFRMLQHGQNPDVVLQEALAGAGSQLVPRPLGDVTGTWEGAAGGIAVGHLAFAQEFIPGTQDAWRVALDSIHTGKDFTAAARRLGIATASVHEALARILPTVAASDEQRAALTAGWRRRLYAALAQAPVLYAHSYWIEGVFARAAAAPWPGLQRVHGDYHLGQVLNAPGRGWVLLDFEGEPLRSLAERNEPDLALRDVAGMLRSVDYAAGSIEREHSETVREVANAQRTAAAAAGPAVPSPVSGSGQVDPSRWAVATSAAFLEGYASIAGDPRSDPAGAALLDALLLDKALYEVVYEARHRPSWVDIPVGAVQRLCVAAALTAPGLLPADTPVGPPTDSPAATSPPAPSHERSASDVTASQPPTTPEPVAPAEVAEFVEPPHPPEPEQAAVVRNPPASSAASSSSAA
ncbi:MAG: 1,4-alpha-glucan branching enzyme, partial [Micrococcales bacterium]|nr:1,4-alpha-glucan branching enzyme [Micrococcales bacterium]